MLKEQAGSFQAGEWLVDPKLNALRRDGKEFRVEPKVMQVLVVLATEGNRVWSKEELITAVWPDTFVGDDVLTRCVSILRRVTGDNPQAPRFIQTVPKVGYRLVAAVRRGAPVVEEEAPAPVAMAEPLPAAVAMLPPAEPVATMPVVEPAGEDAREVGGFGRQGRRWVPLGLLALLLVGAALVWWTWHRARGGLLGSAVAESFQTAQLTFLAGEQVEPTFSPDGETVAYVRLPEDGSSRQIFLAPVRGGEPRELRKSPDEQFSPAWSRDGTQIAFLARGSGGLGLYLAEVRGTAAARRVYVPEVATHWEQGALSWAPDGRSLIFPDHHHGSPGSSIWSLDLASGQLQQLTTPPLGWEGDLTPSWSPDGRWVAFTRASETAVRNIFRLDRRTGAVEQLTQTGGAIDSLAWSRDSVSILFSSNRGGKYALWKIAATGGAAERLPFGTEDAYQPAAGPQAGQYAYTQGSAVWSIDRLTDSGRQSGVVLSSTQQDSAPALSPDATRMAFQSRRSGNQEIWMSGLDGSGLRQLTTMNGAVTGSPAWSYDGQSIAFDSRPDGHSHIFVTEPEHGGVRQLTSGDYNDIVPRWSRDDRSLYFRSNRGGRWRLWRMAADGTAVTAVTENDGIAAEESSDHQWLFYARGDGPGLWRLPLAGGHETEILPEPMAGYWGYFGVAEKGIYFLDRAEPPGVVRFLDFATGKVRTAATLRGTAPQLQGLSVSRDGTVLLVGEEREQGRHITLVTRR